MAFGYLVGIKEIYYFCSWVQRLSKENKDFAYYDAM